MSNEKVTIALLRGYSGPFFPDDLAAIQKRFNYHPERFNDMLYERVRERLGRGARLKHFPQTSDVTSPTKTPWSHGISFMLRGRRFKILFPMALDSDKRDGSFALRHVALYGPEDITFQEVQSLKVGKYIAHVFVNTYRMKYKRAITQSKAEKQLG